jgi:hypothetical protein
VVLGAPGDELAQVQGIGLTGQASVAGEERRQCVPLGVGERHVDDRDVDGRRCDVLGLPLPGPDSGRSTCDRMGEHGFEDRLVGGFKGVGMG